MRTALLVLGCYVLLSAVSVRVYSLAQADVISLRLYELVTETSMPHLEENLRYTTTREKRCLDRTQLASAFPVLRHASLKGCTLGDETRQQGTISYVLTCEGGNATKGSAVWRIGEHQIRGTLNVKLGGKNLTLYQRITATPVGACSES